MRVVPSPFPWCSGRTASEWIAMVLPWSWWPSGSESVGDCTIDDDLLCQSAGMPMVASVTKGDDVRVAMMWATRVGRGFGWLRCARGRENIPRDNSGHFVNRYIICLKVSY